MPAAPTTPQIPTDVNPNVAALHRISIFSSLDVAGRTQIAQHCRRRRIEEPNVPLFQEGDDPGSLYMILSGCVRVQSVTSSGKSVYLAERGPGEAVGELSLIDGAPRMADVVTGEACDLLVLRRDAFLRCLRENPDIALSVMAMLAQRLREAGRQLAERDELDVTGRLARLLLDQMARHGEKVAPAPTPAGRPAAGAIRLAIRQTHQQMAEQIGASRETVTRALGEMRRMRIIASAGREIVILSPDRLQQQAERH